VRYRRCVLAPRSLLLASLLPLSLSACVEPAPAALALAHAPLVAPAPGPSLSGEATLAPGTIPRAGTLVVGWLTPAEAAERKSGHQDIGAFRRLIERFRVVGPVDFARTPRAPFRIDAPADAHPLVVVDVDHTFWSTMFGRGAGLIGLGDKGGGPVVLEGPHDAKPSSAPTSTSTPAPATEPCSGDRYRLLVVQAPEVAGAVGNPTARRFCAYLPPSYRDAPARRYPLVLLLPGLFSTEMSRMRGPHSAAESVDSIARTTGREVILVGVDTSTGTGSTYLVDSPRTGAFDTFLAGRALAAIEAELRTLPDRLARALVGNSTGGLNAISFGMRHPERFSAIGASSPDAADLRAWLLDDGGTPRPWIVAWARLEEALGGPGQMTSYAADWSPDASRPRGVAWPVDLATGRVDDAVLARWIAQSPAGMLRDASTRARTRLAFGGRIFITVGRGDEFGLFEPARRFGEALGAAGIEATFAPTEGGHGDGASERVEAALRFVIGRLAAAR
jgi:S-formylglutathione hydrolase FrmB